MDQGPLHAVRDVLRIRREGRHVRVLLAWEPGADGSQSPPTWEPIHQLHKDLQTVVRAEMRKRVKATKARQARTRAPQVASAPTSQDASVPARQAAENGRVAGSKSKPRPMQSSHDPPISSPPSPSARDHRAAKRAQASTSHRSPPPPRPPSLRSPRVGGSLRAARRRARQLASTIPRVFQDRVAPRRVSGPRGPRRTLGRTGGTRLRQEAPPSRAPG